MENRYNTLIINRKTYYSEEDYFQAIGNAINMLQKNDYTIVIPRRECDFTMLEYNYGDPQMGTAMPIWLTPEEEESVEYREGF